MSFLIVSLGVAATAFLVTYMDFAFTEVGNSWQFSDLPIGLSTLPILFLTLEIPRLALLGESGEPEALFWKKRAIRHVSILFLILYLGHLLLR